MQRKIRVAITHGDTNGIGYELILKTFSEPTILDLCTFIVYGSPKIATYHRKAINSEVSFNLIRTAEEAVEGEINMVNCFDDEVKIDFGVATPESGNAAYRALERAMEDYKAGLFDVLVTAPINKAAIQSADFQFPGHTEYLADRCGGDAQPLMLLCNNLMRVALVTTHLPISKVAENITAEALQTKIELLYQTLLRDFNLPAPRIAVLALNPHAGDAGLLGNEEEEIIKPAIKEMMEKGVPVFGPYPADGFFGSGSYKAFDAVLAMYHDQGLAPFKALSMEDGYNYTAGLDIIRTSPDHGTAYDLAGKGEADESSFRSAIYAAVDVFNSRSSYDEAHRNPLPKLYVDHREERRGHHHDNVE